MENISYPVRYPMVRGWRVVFVVCGLTMLALAVFLDPECRTCSKDGLFELLARIGFGLLGAALGGYALLGRPLLILHVDAIEIPGLFRNVRIARESIKGYRRATDGATSGGIDIHYAVSKDGKQKKSGIEPFFRHDNVLDQWLAPFPDLGALEKQALMHRVESDSRMGKTPEARLKNLGRAPKITSVTSLALIVLFLLAMTYAPSIEWVLFPLALLPWLAFWLLHRFPDALAVESTRRGRFVRGDLTILLLLPMLILLVMMSRANFTDWPSLLALSSPVWGLTTYCLYRSADDLRARPLILTLYAILFLAPYAAGVTTLVDTSLDFQPPQGQLAIVVEKHLVKGKTVETFFDIAPWGPVPERERIKVGLDLYIGVEPGEPICMQLHPGAIGVPWYQLRPAANCR